MIKFKSLLIMATFLSASMLISPAIAKTLVYCSDGSPEGFDPALHTSETTLDASSLIYDRLVEIVPGETAVQPSLAQSWSTSENGLEYTFNLRSGVKFQKRDYFEPTRDFNADDVVFSFERQLKADNPWYEYAKGKSWKYFNALSMQDLIKEIEKVDDFTVKFTLNRADTPFLHNLTMDYASIVSKEYAESLEKDGDMKDFDTKPVGTGPYSFVSYEKDVIARYRVNPEYWDGEKQMHSIVYVIFPDAEDRLEKMKLSQCHAMSYPNVENLEEISANEQLTLKEEQGLNVVYLAYNTEVPPFDNPDVRKALNMAIDKQAILDEGFGGKGQLAKNPIPPTMWSYNEEIEDDKFDPEAVKSALEKAGAEDISMNLLLKQEQDPYQRIAELIQSDFESIGINVEIVMDTTKDTTEVADSETDGTETDNSDNTPENESVDKPAEMNEPIHAILHKWDDKNGDPDNFLSVLLGCDGVDAFNYARWCSEEYDTLIKEAKTGTQQEERAERYKKAQEIFKEQAPWATLVHAPIYVPMSNQIVDYSVDPRGKHSFINTNFYEEPEEEEGSEESDNVEIAPIEIDLGDASANIEKDTGSDEIEFTAASEAENSEAAESIETLIESVDDTIISDQSDGTVIDSTDNENSESTLPDSDESSSNADGNEEAEELTSSDDEEN